MPAPDLVPLDDATDPTRFGQKAATLAMLRKEAFDVPDGFVLGVNAAPTAEDIRAALERLGDCPVAVRSSSLAEDLADASFAGHYVTVLDVRGVDGVIAAAKKCVDSTQAEHVPAHVKNGGATMAVLVQKMVAASAAGIAFSANPVTGERAEVRVNATRGRGDRLAGGEVTGDEWVVRGGRAITLAERETAIDAALATRIAALAQEVEAARGGPQDIEWAVEGGRLVLLQARPITVLPVRPKIEPPKGTWEKDGARFTEPVSPFAASTHLAYSGQFADAIAVWGLMPDALECRVIGHEFYVHAEPDDGGKSPPPWWVLGIAARLVPSLRRKLRAARNAVEGGLLESIPEEWHGEWKPLLRRRIEAFAKIDLGALSDEDLASELTKLEAFAHESMRLHFKLFIPHAVGVHELAAVCKELLGWETPEVMRLLQGLSLASSAPTRELESIAHASRGRPAEPILASRGADVLARLREEDPDIGARLESYLGVWGLRTFDGDPASKAVREEPRLVVELLADLLTSEVRDMSGDRAGHVAEARARLEDRAARARFDAALAYAEKTYPLREDNVILTEQLPIGMLRRVALEMGRRLVARGVLACVDDVFMLTATDLRTAVIAREVDAQARESWRRAARRHRAEMAWVRAHPGPMRYGPAPATPPDLRGLPAPARRVNASLLWFLAQEWTAPRTGGDLLRGVPASAGTYRGRVRVIRHASDLGALRSGEVLVCPTTSSAWMMVFQRAGALVADSGSTLSHTAIVAREHGLPAVVAVSGATGVLHDGEEVVVDGGRGTITRCSSS